MNELASAGGWVTALILGGFGLITELLRRRTTRQADKERGPIDGYSALALSQRDYQDSLHTRIATLEQELDEARKPGGHP